MLVLQSNYSEVTEDYLPREAKLPSMSEDDRVGNTTTTHIEFGPPKFQGTIREYARVELGANDLEYEKGEYSEKMVVKAELEVIEVKTKQNQRSNSSD